MRCSDHTQMKIKQSSKEHLNSTLLRTTVKKFEIRRSSGVMNLRGNVRKKVSQRSGVRENLFP